MVVNGQRRARSILASKATRRQQPPRSDRGLGKVRWSATCGPRMNYE